MYRNLAKYSFFSDPELNPDFLKIRGGSNRFGFATLGLTYVYKCTYTIIKVKGIKQQTIVIRILL